MGWEHGFPSPSSALFVKQVMVQAEECAWPPTSRPRLSLFSLFHPCLVLSCPVFLTISNPYFTLLSACGGTGTQRAPGTCQSQRDGNGGAEKPPPRQMGLSEDLCGAGSVWPSFYVVSSQTCTWALHSQFLLRKNVKK